MTPLKQMQYRDIVDDPHKLNQLCRIMCKELREKGDEEVTW